MHLSRFFLELFSSNIQHKGGYFCHCCCKTFALNIFQRSSSFCSNNKELFFMIGTISFFCVILGGITRGVELLLVLNWIPISWPWCQGVLELERWTSTNFRRTTSRLLVDICAFQPCKRVLGRIFIVSQFHHHFVHLIIPAALPTDDYVAICNDSVISGKIPNCSPMFTI